MVSYSSVFCFLSIWYFESRTLDPRSVWSYHVFPSVMCILKLFFLVRYVCCLKLRYNFIGSTPHFEFYIEGHLISVWYVLAVHSFVSSGSNGAGPLDSSWGDGEGVWLSVCGVGSGWVSVYVSATCRRCPDARHVCYCYCWNSIVLNGQWKWLYSVSVIDEM